MYNCENHINRGQLIKIGGHYPSYVFEVKSR